MTKLDLQKDVKDTVIDLIGQIGKDNDENYVSKCLEQFKDIHTSIRQSMDDSVLPKLLNISKV